MAPKILILDAEAVEADVEIRPGGTGHCQQPESPWHGTSKARLSPTKRDKSVSQGSRHLTASEQATEEVARETRMAAWNGPGNRRRI